MLEYYLLLKTAHILAVMLWLACACGDLWFLSHPGSHDSVQAWRAGPGRVGHLVLALVWVLGLILMHLGHWHVFAWMKLKLALVVALSALHGSASARLRRSASYQIWRGPLLVVLVSLVVALIVNKGSATPKAEHSNLWTSPSSRPWAAVGIGPRSALWLKNN